MDIGKKQNKTKQNKKKKHKKKHDIKTKTRDYVHIKTFFTMKDIDNRIHLNQINSSIAYRNCSYYSI